MRHPAEPRRRQAVRAAVCRDRRCRRCAGGKPLRGSRGGRASLHGCRARCRCRCRCGLLFCGLGALTPADLPDRPLRRRRHRCYVWLRRYDSLLRHPLLWTLAPCNYALLFSNIRCLKSIRILRLKRCWRAFNAVRMLHGKAVSALRPTQAQHSTRGLRASLTGYMRDDGSLRFRFRFRVTVRIRVAVKEELSFTTIEWWRADPLVAHGWLAPHAQLRRRWTASVCTAR